jgi:hypothetical protein
MSEDEKTLTPAGYWQQWVRVVLMAGRSREDYERFQDLFRRLPSPEPVEPQP